MCVWVYVCVCLDSTIHCDLLKGLKSLSTYKFLCHLLFYKLLKITFFLLNILQTFSHHSSRLHNIPLGEYFIVHFHNPLFLDN